MIYGNGNETINLMVYDHSTGTEHKPTNAPLSFRADDRTFSNPAMPYIVEIIGSPMGFDDPLYDLANITIYPNPTAGELRIANGEWTMESIDVLDIYGRKIECKIVNIKSEIVIDISHSPSGVYFVTIKTDKGVVTKKVVKK